ncbi:hypothetical protein FIBSPDRAFT_900054 [Athelia psychrophila]|uniref:Uncharacterized protein n=1 Tax=Athelia psychrophila TaxID=1759441 RepID=A0A165YWT9_9AGAM|nr:hypothetical protein FIBSPDRAFT_900054 [Fibularhizoctonia sp. CBS 109695]
MYSGSQRLHSAAQILGDTAIPLVTATAVSALPWTRFALPWTRVTVDNNRKVELSADPLPEYRRYKAGVCVRVLFRWSYRIACRFLDASARLYEGFPGVTYTFGTGQLVGWFAGELEKISLSYLTYASDKPLGNKRLLYVIPGEAHKFWRRFDQAQILLTYSPLQRTLSVSRESHVVMSHDMTAVYFAYIDIRKHDERDEGHGFKELVVGQQAPQEPLADTPVSLSAPRQSAPLSLWVRRCCERVADSLGSRLNRRIFDLRYFIAELPHLEDQTALTGPRLGRYKECGLREVVTVFVKTLVLRFTT